ncbi:neopullulanase 2 [bacterium BMS3Abin04]|nr:neopullulanase 2 [bacterium BMS3Abin04]
MFKLIQSSLLLFALTSNLSGQNIPQDIPRVPGWAKQAVWYQIFPERFNNGDRLNDPRPNDMNGGWPYKIPKGWQISPWTSDWYKLQPWEKQDGHDFYWNAGVRRYGGDLQGVIDKLDYLKDLGITAIYFNPLFESPSLHKYDASMYRHIDNNFGPKPYLDPKVWAKENPADPATWRWTSADFLFLKLIKLCHERNIKVIIDGVFNHVGTTFWAFQDVIRNQENSKFKDWFYIKSFDNPKTDSNEFDYAGWYGVKDLPELKEDENGLIPPIREHIHAIVKRWMDPNDNGDPSDGIDGWRLDVADMVNHNFWKDFRKWVKHINPNAYITGEVWWKDWEKNIMFDAAPWLQGDQFDAVMNYRFTRAVKRFVSDKKLHITPTSFVDSLQNIMSDYPPENFSVLMNLLGSHDTERLASLIVNPDQFYDHYGNPKQNPDFKIRKPNRTERLKQALMVGIQMTLPGAPMIYYGDEAGMWGGDDPDDRKPMVWPELSYETEKTHPFGKQRTPDSVYFDQSIFQWYKKLISIRNDNRALSIGDIKFLVKDDQREILVYSRIYDTQRILILINNKNSQQSFTLNKNMTGNKTELQDMISGRIFNPGLVTLYPYQILILK